MEFQWHLIKRQITIASFIYLSQVLNTTLRCENCCQTLKNNLQSLVNLYAELDEKELHYRLKNLPNNLRNTLVYFNFSGLLVLIETNEGYLSVGNCLDILRTLTLLGCCFSKTPWYHDLENLLQESVSQHKIIKVE